MSKNNVSFQFFFWGVAILSVITKILFHIVFEFSHDKLIPTTMIQIFYCIFMMLIYFFSTKNIYQYKNISGKFIIEIWGIMFLLKAVMFMFISLLLASIFTENFNDYIKVSNLAYSILPIIHFAGVMVTAYYTNSKILKGYSIFIQIFYDIFVYSRYKLNVDLDTNIVSNYIYIITFVLLGFLLNKIVYKNE